MTRTLAALALLAPAAALAQNEAVHVVELTPAGPRKGLGLAVTVSNPVQLNQKFTEHYGLALQAAWHFRENLSWTILNANWFYRGVRSAFSQELTRKAHLQPETASSLTLHWGLDTGLEFAPVYGKFAFMGAGVVHFQIFAHGGAGLASTRVEIRDEGDDIRPWYETLFGRYVSMGRTFGDTGLRPYAVLGGGARVFLGQSWSINLEFRDLVYSADVQTINGCTQGDIAKMSSGGTVTTQGCSANQPDPWLNKQADGALAFDLLKPPDDRSALFTSDVLNNVFFYGGASFIF